MNEDVAYARNTESGCKLPAFIFLCETSGHPYFRLSFNCKLAESSLSRSPYPVDDVNYLFGNSRCTIFV